MAMQKSECIPFVGGVLLTLFADTSTIPAFLYSFWAGILSASVWIFLFLSIVIDAIKRDADRS